MSGPTPARPSPVDWVDLLRPRRTRGQLLVGVLCALVGFALVVTVNVQRSPRSLDRASQEDLVRILADLNTRSDRLRTEVAQLQQEQDLLAGSSGRSETAIEDARRRAAALGILAGTVAASGPGITMTVTDPKHSVRADGLLNAVEELRDAGAEALQIGSVRVVASTYLRDTAGGIVVDGATVTPPYRLIAIGDAHTMTNALGIPGGVLDATSAYDGAKVDVVASTALVVDALKAPTTPRYARQVPTAAATR